MTANYVANVPKLLGRENYSTWVYAAESFLILEGTKKFIEKKPECSKPESSKTESSKEPDSESVLDEKTRAKLVLTIDPSLYVHIKGVKTTFELWDKLKRMFDDSGFARRITLLRNLISIRLENCKSMTAYVTEMIANGQKLSSTGFEISDEWIGSLLLAGLPDKFSPMIMAIEHSGIPITTDAIKTKLLDMEEKNLNENGNDVESAFASVSSHQYQHNKKNKPVVYGKQVGSFGGGETSKVKMTVKCFRCKQSGHYRNQCPNSDSNPTFSKNSNNNNSRKQSNAFSAVFLSGEFKKDHWYIDSGCSAHLTANESWIRDASYEPAIREIVVANKESVPVLCTGNVQIATVTCDSEYDITVENVLCVPALTTNLLSVSQLIQKGNKVDFSEENCKVYNKSGHLVATATLTNGVYKLNMPDTTVALAVSAETWHRRLGHVNASYMSKMQNAVEGLDIGDKVSLDKCKVCCEGKQCRLPFPSNGNRSESLLNIIHMDLAGPMEVTSIGGSRYYFLLVDDCSRMAFIYFLKHKNEALSCFKEFKAKVENELDRKIKIVRSDNGLEFCNRDFREFLNANGIIHQRTNTYTPEQNGLCERLNRTVVEKARCLLYDGELGTEFWAEACSCAVYLRNRTVASGLDGKTPYEVWTGRKPDLSHLRIFGSTVMVHVPKEKRLKWQKKSQECILLGYPENIKGYRVYNPVTKTILTSRDVVVIEKNTKTASCEIEVQEMKQTKSHEATQTVMNQSQVSVGVESTDSCETCVNPTDESFVPSDFEDAEATVTSSTPVKSGPVLRTASERKQPDRYGLSNLCMDVAKMDDASGLSLSEALHGPEKEQWKRAMAEELKSFEDNEAWELVNVPKGASVVKCKWVLKKKYDSENNVRFRARLVAKGYTQRYGVDYDETYAPVVRHTTLRLLFALSVQLGLDISHLDVTTAFLNGYLDEDIYMQKPEGFPEGVGKGQVLKLKKAVYGLKQASRAWYHRVEDCLLKFGYKKSKIEPCLFVKNVNGLRTYIALYVDDFFVFSNSEEETRNLISELSSHFKLKDLGQVKQCLGMNVCIDKENGVITLDQESYVNQLLHKFNMTDCKVADTPMEEKLNLQKGEKCETVYPYQQLIGSLMYLAVQTRPDIAFSVGYLSQFNNCFGKEHWTHAKRVLRYLKKTKHFCLRYSREGDAKMTGFVDADWGSDVLDRRSYTGFCFNLSGCVISWGSKKQRCVALSSTEAEYIGISECTREAMYLRNLQREVTEDTYCVVIFNDNQSAQKLLTNPVFHNRSKHVDIRYHYCREIAAEGLVETKYIPTADMPADLLTKSLGSVKHYRFIDKLGIMPK